MSLPDFVGDRRAVTHSTLDPLLEVVIPGQPVGKGRPLASVRGGHVHMRTPEKTAAWEDRAAWAMRCAWAGRAALDCAVAVDVVAVCRRPQSLHRKKDPPGRINCLTKPDIDNCVKCALDALVLAHVLVDDTRCVELRARKLYAAIGEQEHVEVAVRAL